MDHLLLLLPEGLVVVLGQGVDKNFALSEEEENGSLRG